jgi:AcrR family transcriptional regulator
MSPRRSQIETRETHTTIVERAVDIASIEGLEGITIGRLAADLGMSKAGVFGHFGTKEALQLAVLERANARFRRDVWEPAAREEPGLPRLLAICDAWMDYLEGETFPGGCFLTAASCEFDGRPGPVHDAVAATMRLWLRVLADEVRAAKRAGDLPRSVDPDLVAFQLNAIAMGTNHAVRLQGDPRAAERCHAAMERVLTQRRAPG